MECHLNGSTLWKRLNSSTYQSSIWTTCVDKSATAESYAMWPCLVLHRSGEFVWSLWQCEKERKQGIAAGRNHTYPFPPSNGPYISNEIIAGELWYEELRQLNIVRTLCIRAWQWAQSWRSSVLSKPKAMHLVWKIQFSIFVLLPLDRNKSQRRNLHVCPRHCSIIPDKS